MPKTDELVPQAALDELKALDAQLAASAAKMREVFTEANNIRRALSDAALSYKDLVAAIGKFEAIQKQAATTEREAKKAMTEKERLQQRIIKLETAEGAEVQKLRLELQKKTQATKDDIRAQQAAEGSLNQLRAALIRARKEYDAMGASVRNSAKGKGLREEIGRLHSQVLLLEQSTGRSQRNVGNYFGSFVKGFKSMLGAASVLTVAIKAFGLLKDAIGGAFAAAFEFEKASSKLAAILGTTKEGVHLLTEEAKRLGASTVFTAAEVLALETELAKLGFLESEILDSTEAVLKFAQATDAGLGEAAALAGAALRAFGADAKEMERYVASMAVATTKSALSFSYIETALSTVAPVANAFGFTIEDTLTLLGKLADAGFDASSAATATRNILLNLADANGQLAGELGRNVKTLPELAQALTDLKKRGISLSEALELTDKRSVSAFNSFLSSADSLVALREQLTGAEDELSRMSHTMNDNVQGAWTGLKSAWEGFALGVIKSTGWIKDALNAAASALRGLTRLVTKEDKAKMYDDALEKTVNMQSETGRLLNRYEELTEKTVKTKEEHEEYSAVMEKLSRMYPGIVTGIDEYGNATEIAAEKVRALMALEKERLKLEHGKTVKALTKDVDELDRRRAVYRDRFRRGETIAEGSAIGSAISTPVYRTLTDAEIDETRRQIQDISAQREAAQERIDLLTGRTFDRIYEDAVTLQKMKTEFNAMDEAALKSWVDANKEASEEISEAVIKAAKDTYQKRFAEPAEREKAEAEQRKREAEEEKRRKLKEAEAERKKRAESERKAAQELAVFRIQAEADTEKRIADDANRAFGERLAAIRNYYQAQAEAVRQAAENQLDNGDLTASQRELIQQKLLAELEKLEYNYVKDVTDLENDRVKSAEEAAQKRIKIQEKLFRSTERGISADESAEIGDLTAEYAAGRMKHEKYEEQKADITRRYAEVRMNAEADHIRSLMGLAGLSADQQEQLAQKLADAEIKYEQYMADTKIAIDLKAARKREEIERDLAEKRKELLGEALSFAETLISAQFEGRLNEIDREQEALEKSAEAEIKRIEEQEEAGVLSREQADAQKGLIEYNAQLRSDMLEEKRRQTLERQAKFEKASTVTGIALNTALAIMAQLASTSLPLGAPLVAFIAATGALQLAAALAQPLPKYARGTADHPGGLAVVGDGGRREIGILPDGRRFLTPDLPTLMDLPPHTGILPDAERVLGREAARLNGRVETRSVIVEMNAEPLEEGQKATNERLDAIARCIRKIRLNARYSSRMSRLDRTIHLKKNL